MAKKLTDVEELVHRAQSNASTPEHRYVYGDSSSASVPRFVVRPNRRAVGRKVSTFYLILVLFGVGIAIVAYINNIITVNKLAVEINQMQVQYDKIANSNAALMAEINRKSGWERIGKIASEQAGLRYLNEQPALFDVDEDMMDAARQKSQQGNEAIQAK